MCMKFPAAVWESRARLLVPAMHYLFCRRRVAVASWMPGRRPPPRCHLSWHPPGEFRVVVVDDLRRRHVTVFRPQLRVRVCNVSCRSRRVLDGEDFDPPSNSCSIIRYSSRSVHIARPSPGGEVRMETEDFDPSACLSFVNNSTTGWDPQRFVSSSSFLAAVRCALVCNSCTVGDVGGHNVDPYKTSAHLPLSGRENPICVRHRYSPLPSGS